MSPPLEDWRLELEASTVAQAEESRAKDPVSVPALTILHHPDPDRIGEVAPLLALCSGREVELSRLEPRFAQPRGGEARPLADAHLSRRPLRLRPATTPGGVLIDPAGASTELRVDSRPVSLELEIETPALRDGVLLRLADRLVLMLHHLDPTPVAPVDTFGLVGDSPALDALRGAIRRASHLEVPVLLRGETGAGKELVAAAIHGAGRRDGAFVAVNMAAIPTPLAAAELFGAAKGAYTGATSRRDGFFRQADGGTLLLDEIGEAPIALQVLLLRALETGQIQPVGSDRPLPVDVRIIAATDADLEHMARSGDFREPLIHRLAGLVVDVPPLRHRRDDIPRLLLHFLRQELEPLDALHKLHATPRGRRPWLTPVVVERLVGHSWPGNVRQLRNVARQLVAAGWQAEGLEEQAVATLLGEAGADKVARQPQVARATEDPATNRPRTWSGRPSSISADQLRRALRRHGFSLAPTASSLGISRTSLYSLLDRFGIRRASQIGAREIETGLGRHGGDFDALAAELEVSAAGLRQRWRQWRDLGSPGNELAETSDRPTPDGDADAGA